jgi:hypothetical protein
MAGGLLQIVSAGKEDIFLTIDPQITFFKTVYLKYSNFAIETVEEQFDGFCNFGEEVVCNLSKIGDLIHTCYVKIQLPKVLIQRLNPPSTPDPISTLTLSNFNTYSKPLFSLWRKLYANISSSSSNYNTVKNIVDTFVSSDEYQSYSPYKNQFRSVQHNATNSMYNFDLVELFDVNYRNSTFSNSVYDPIDTQNFKTSFLRFLLTIKHKAISYKQQLVEATQEATKTNKIEYNNYYRFAWVRQIGLRLIEKITFELGGQVIDSITSDMLNIWNQVTVKEEHLSRFNQMVGNVDILTSYTSDEHPMYTLYIPIPFWFSRHHGAALPCVALRYHDVQISVKFKDINDCCFFEPYEEALVDDVNLAEQVKLMGASLLIDYVYLDIDEKNKYGNSHLEYLIEQHQYLQFSDIAIKSFNTSLTFVNPVKELFWVAQLESNVRRYKAWDRYYDVNMSRILGFMFDQSENLVRVSVQQYDVQAGDHIQISKSKYFNGLYPILSFDVDANGMTSSIYIRKTPSRYIQYTFIPDGFGYCEIIKQDNANMETMQLIANGIDMTPKCDPSFFNSVMAHKRHTRSPDDSGIYMYAYAMHPELFQPTGSSNMSLFSSNDIYFKTKDALINRIKKTKDRMVVKVFARSINILSINKGISYLEFSA